MSRRQTYEISGVKHSMPIPMGARVGSSFRSSGVNGKDPMTSTLPADGVKQVEFAFANARSLLDVAGIALDQVVYVDVLLADAGLRDEVNKHWLGWFPDEHDRPARHTTARELSGGMKVQLLLQAHVDTTGG